MAGQASHPRSLLSSLLPWQEAQEGAFTSRQGEDGDTKGPAVAATSQQAGVHGGRWPGRMGGLRSGTAGVCSSTAGLPIPERPGLQEDQVCEGVEGVTVLWPLRYRRPAHPYQLLCTDSAAHNCAGLGHGLQVPSPWPAVCLGPHRPQSRASGQACWRPWG